MVRKRPALILFLSFVLLFSSVSLSSSVRNSTRRTGSPNPRFSNPGEDYSDYYEDTLPTEKPRKPSGSPAPLCEYDLCKDRLDPCLTLALTLFCSCPGISGPFQRPDPPSVHGLSVESNGATVVRWCAPASTVSHYHVYVGGKKTGDKVAENRRMMELGDLAAGTEVCVEALNKAGSSERGEHSCIRFEPNDSETRLITKLALMGAAVVLVLAIALAWLLWWCKRHRKTPARTSNRATGAVL